jgi:hypothetical protein
MLGEEEVDFSGLETAQGKIASEIQVLEILELSGQRL